VRATGGRWTVAMRQDPRGQWLVDSLAEDKRPGEALRRAVRGQVTGIRDTVAHERADSA
jgi:hypothetical protein